MNRGGMQLDDFQKEVEDYLLKEGVGELHGTQPVDGLFLLRHLKPTPLEATLYEPVICLILQGQKEVCVGEAVVRVCLLYTSPSPRDVEESRMPSSA